MFFEKVKAYLKAGTRMVWVVDPVLKTVAMYQPEKPIRIFTNEDTLTGEDVLEGFTCTVAQLFE